MNLTVTADETVIRRARLAAQKRGTSLNALLREYMERLGEQTAGEAAAEEWTRLVHAGGGRSNGERFRREDAYDLRRVGRA